MLIFLNKNGLIFEQGWLTESEWYSSNIQNFLHTNLIVAGSCHPCLVHYDHPLDLLWSGHFDLSAVQSDHFAFVAGSLVVGASVGSCCLGDLKNN